MYNCQIDDNYSELFEWWSPLEKFGWPI